jgi:hypothetical protein
LSCYWTPWFAFFGCHSLWFEACEYFHIGRSFGDWYLCWFIFFFTCLHIFMFKYPYLFFCYSGDFGMCVNVCNLKKMQLKGFQGTPFEFFKLNVRFYILFIKFIFLESMQHPNH